MMEIQNQYTTEENLIKAVQCLSLAAGGNAKYCFMAAVRKKRGNIPENTLQSSWSAVITAFCFTDLIWLFSTIAMTFLKASVSPSHLHCFLLRNNRMTRNRKWSWQITWHMREQSVISDSASDRPCSFEQNDQKIQDPIWIRLIPLLILQAGAEIPLKKSGTHSSSSS